MKYALLIDTTRCSICFACQVACKDEFVGNVYPPYSYSQPDIEQEWIKVFEIEKGKFPYVKVYPIPKPCMHCEDPACKKACPVPGAITKKSSGIVLIDPETCDPAECETKPCITGCPYGSVFFNTDSNIAQKCTLCIHRLKEGKEPACVNACPSGVYTFGEESAILKEAKKRGATYWHPEYNTSPSVYYIGLPSITLAGHIISEKSLMDVPDAEVTVSNAKAGKPVSFKSDLSGNFCVRDLNMNDTYSVSIKCQGYQPKSVDKVRIDLEYKHLGDVKLKPG